MYIASFGEGGGKSTVALGLAELLSRQVGRIGEAKIVVGEVAAFGSGSHDVVSAVVLAGARVRSKNLAIDTIALVVSGRSANI